MKMKRIGSGALFLASLVFLVVASAGFSFAQDNRNSNKAQESPLNKPLKVKTRPKPSPRGCRDIESGKTVIRLTFDRSAKVTKVVLVVRSGCPQFDASAVDAAQRIEFEPAVKNGEPISVVKKMEYAFFNR